MLKSSYFFPFSVLLVSIAVLHWIASSSLDFYTTVLWFDIVMHFLGGAWLVSATMWLTAVYVPDRFLRFVSVQNFVLVAIALGLGWEIFELIMGFTSFQMAHYWSDTFYDLIMDSVGAFTMAHVFKRFF